MVVGSIHSHPNGVAGPSEADNDSAVEEKETVFAIYSFDKLASGKFAKAELTFWEPQKPLQVEVISKPKPASAAAKPIPTEPTECAKSSAV